MTQLEVALNFAIFMTEYTFEFKFHIHIHHFMFLFTFFT